MPQSLLPHVTIIVLFWRFRCFIFRFSQDRPKTWKKNPWLSNFIANVTDLQVHIIVSAWLNFITTIARNKINTKATCSLLFGRCQRINKKTKNPKLWVNVDMQDQQFYSILSNLPLLQTNIIFHSPWVNIKILSGFSHSIFHQDSSFEIYLEDAIFYFNFPAFVSKLDFLQLITTIL